MIPVLFWEREMTMKRTAFLFLTVLMVGCASSGAQIYDPSAHSGNQNSQHHHSSSQNSAQKRVCLRVDQHQASVRSDVVTPNVVEIYQRNRHYRVHLSQSCRLDPQDRFYGVYFSDGPGQSIRLPNGQWRHAAERRSNWVCDGQAGQYLVIQEFMIQDQWPKSCKIERIERIK